MFLEIFAFTATQWTIPRSPLTIVNKYQSFTFKCQTNDVFAKVTLLRSKVAPYLQWVNAMKTFNGRMKKVGQNFYVARILPHDGGEYKCVAKDSQNSMEIEHIKGQVIVTAGTPQTRSTPRQIKFQFITEQWTSSQVPRSGSSIPIKFINSGRPLVITCKTNDHAAQVTLLRSRVFPYRPWTDALLTYNGRMKQIGQTFSIATIAYQDAGDYKCIAQSMDNSKRIAMIKGRLIVAEGMCFYFVLFTIKPDYLNPGKMLI